MSDTLKTIFANHAGKIITSLLTIIIALAGTVYAQQNATDDKQDKHLDQVQEKFEKELDNKFDKESFKLYMDFQKEHRKNQDKINEKLLQAVDELNRQLHQRSL